MKLTGDPANGQTFHFYFGDVFIHFLQSKKLLSVFRSKFRWYVFLVLSTLQTNPYLFGFSLNFVTLDWKRYCWNVYLCMVGSINDILGSFQQFFRWPNMSHFRPEDELDDCSLLSPVPMKNDGFGPALKIWVITTRNLQKRGGFPIVYSYTIYLIYSYSTLTSFCENRVLLVSKFYLFRNRRKPSFRAQHLKETLSDDALHGVWEELDHKNEGELVWWPSWGETMAQLGFWKISEDGTAGFHNHGVFFPFLFTVAL